MPVEQEAKGDLTPRNRTAYRDASKSGIDEVNMAGKIVLGFVV